MCTTGDMSERQNVVRVAKRTIGRLGTGPPDKEIVRLDVTVN